MPANVDGFDKLAAFFSEYGVESFLASTSALVVVMDNEGRFLSWNPSFDQLKQKLPRANLVKDLLSPAGKARFDTCLKTMLHERTRQQAILEFSSENHWGDFVSHFIPLPDQRILFIAERSRPLNDLETIRKELHKTKRSLAIKETELKAVIAQADEVSHTDSLTFLPNRRSIISDLQRETMFSERYGTPLAISMVDIDHFKNINDTYGHVAGDNVLKKLSMEMRERIRHPDTMGRYGGEEFLVVLPHSTIKAATEQAERLCKHVHSLVIQSHDANITLTVSIGVAQFRIHKEDWQTFLRRADSVLYQAKNNGRNQWVAAEE